jgi:cytidylate kinase
MIRVLTIGGEYGAGRAEIARVVADRLGWRLIDNCLIEDIARASNFDPALCREYDETAGTWFQRLRKALWQGGYEGVATTTDETPPDADAIADAAHRVIREAARQGQCVIVGRGSQCVLQDEKDVFHVFIYAPRDQRIERVRRREGPQEDAESLTESWDRRRAAYIRLHFGHDWTNRRLYDLMICSTIGESAAAAAILAAIEGHGK